MTEPNADQPVGWYADPRGEAPLRWWDGNKWTDQVSHSPWQQRLKNQRPATKMEPQND